VKTPQNAASSLEQRGTGSRAASQLGFRNLRRGRDHVAFPETQRVLRSARTLFCHAHRCQSAISLIAPLESS
jgi:hypothetical protein